MSNTTPRSHSASIQDFITPKPRGSAHWFHHAVSEASKTARFMKSWRTALTGSVYKSLSDNYCLLEREFIGKAFRCEGKQSLCQIILLLQGSGVLEGCFILTADLRKIMLTTYLAVITSPPNLT